MKTQVRQLATGCAVLLSTVYAMASATDPNWDIAGLVDSGKRLATAAVTENTRCMDLVDADTLLFIHGRQSRNVVVYELQTRGDLGTAQFLYAFDTTPYFGTRAQTESVGHGIFVKRETLDRMWLWNRTELWAFDMPEPGDVRSARFSGYRSFAGEVTRGHAIHFRPDGGAFYVEDRDQARVHQFSMATPWDIETIVPDGQLDISARHAAVRGLEFNPDGTVMYLLDTELREVQQYGLGQAWNVTSAVFEKAFALGMENPRGMTWNRHGSRLYIMDATTREATQFNVAGAVDPLQLRYEPGPGGGFMGETEQWLPPGGEGAPVEAVPETGARFYRWSDGRMDNPRTDTEIAVDTVVRAYFESDGGVPIDWYQEHGFFPGEGASWAHLDMEDPTAKGMPLRSQFIAALDPNDPVSRFSITSLAIGPAIMIRVQPVRATRRYTVEVSADPSAPDGWDSVPGLVDVIPGPGDTALTLEAPALPEETGVFFRVGVRVSSPEEP